MIHIIFCVCMYRFIKGRTFPGKLLITRSDPMETTFLHSPGFDRNSSENDTGSSKQSNGTNEVDFIDAI